MWPSADQGTPTDAVSGNQKGTASVIGGCQEGDVGFPSSAGDVSEDGTPWSDVADYPGDVWPVCPLRSSASEGDGTASGSETSTSGFPSWVLIARLNALKK